MKKIISILVIILILASIAYAIYKYMGASGTGVAGDGITPMPAVENHLTEDQKLNMLRDLSTSGTSTGADDSLKQKQALLKNLSTPSQGTTTKPTSGTTSSAQSGPSDEERMRILKSLSQ